MAMVQRELTLFLSPSAASWKALKIRKTKGRVFHRRLCYQELPLHHSQRMIRAMVKGGLSGVANMLRRKTLQILSNLPLAIGEMFAVASLMALGICSSFLLFSLLIWTSHMFYLFVVLKKNYGLRRMVVGWHF